MKNYIRSILVVAVATAFSTHAGDIGHFAPGVFNIRDFAVPDAGTYGALYNYYYKTDRINDSHGNQVNSVTIGPAGGPNVTRSLDVNVDMYVVAPVFIYVKDIKSLGIKYGAQISPMLANANMDAILSSATGRGGNLSGSTFGLGDLFVQPLWLGKTTDHWDFAFGYGFYAPIGEYSTELVTLPVVGQVKTEAADNIGYGFWTHQFQLATTWYPSAHKGTAIATALTYENNTKKEGFDVTPGDILTLNWGISQYLPLDKKMTKLLEIGPAGYDSWQITEDSGSQAKTTRDEVHAIGGQIGFTYVPWMMAINFHSFYEYSSKDRSQGQSFGLSIALKF